MEKIYPKLKTFLQPQGNYAKIFSNSNPPTHLLADLLLLALNDKLQSLALRAAKL